MREPHADRRTGTRRAPSGRRGPWVLAAAVSTACVVSSSLGATPDVRVVEDLRPLLIQAIDASSGTSSGILAGPLAQVLRSRAISTDPLHVDVTTLKAYREPGCKRLNVQFRQSNVKLGNDSPVDRELAFQLNYCRDGRPPRSLE
jgi:hypothetical protein